MLRAWCDRHWQMVVAREVDRQRATIALIHRLLSDPRIQQECPPGPDRVALLQQAIETHGPPCCFLGDGAVLDVLNATR